MTNFENDIENDRPIRYATREEAIQQAILPTLDDPSDYDVDGIFTDTFAWRVDLNAAGDEVLDSGGFECMEGERFYWRLVANRARVLDIEDAWEDAIVEYVERGGAADNVMVYETRSDLGINKEAILRRRVDSLVDGIAGDLEMDRFGHHSLRHAGAGDDTHGS